MNREEAQRRIKKLKRELDQSPRWCPWCGEKSMWTHHAPRKHPDKYEEWKQEHERLELGGTIWVEASEKQ